jgi:type IV secretory pathway TrbF-like protein
MSETHWMPPPAKDYAAAKRQYLELHGSLAVMNNYLKIALLAMCVVCVGSIIANVKTIQLFREFRPIVIRINELGRAESVNYTSLVYRPQEPEIKYFLVQFVQLHYARVRATVRENYARSLYFLDGGKADAIIEANKKSNLIETFLTDHSDEIDIRVTSVSIEDLRSPPYRATIDFEKIYSAPDHAEHKREKYTANFVFTFRDRVPNELIPVNPLGFTITYFRDDQAF